MSEIQLSDCKIKLTIDLKCINHSIWVENENSALIEVELDYTHFISNSDLNRLKELTVYALYRYQKENPNKFFLDQNYAVVCKDCRNNPANIR